MLEIAIKVACLIFGVVWILHFVGGVALLIVQPSGSPAPILSRVFVCLGLVMILVVTVFLLKCADTIARRLMPDEGLMVVSDLTEGQPGVFWLALKCVGVVVLLLAVAGLFRLVVQDVPAGGQYLRRQPLTYLAPVLRLLMGVYLFLGGKFLARIAAGAPGSAPAEPDLWRRPLFTLAIRLIGITFVLWYSAWFLHALVLQWHPALRASGQTEMEWNSFVSAAVVLGLGIYLISGARHLVTFVFRRPDADSPAAA